MKYIDFQSKKKYLPYIILFVGCFVRILQLGVVPGGLNQDESFAAYDAYSLLHYGIDSSGYSYPVYFVSWGSGMNVLNSYLMMPFMAVFGAHPWVVRLPQSITACLTLFVFFLLLKKIFDERTALAGLFLLTISPWHIMLSRWALESNLTPGFLLFALYFFVLGVEKSRYYIVSALFYGLSLYCYATIWPIVPLMLLLQAGYLIYAKKLKFDVCSVFAVILLMILALPLVLFILINAGYMEEIRTAFLSIPRLPVMRGSEISFSNMPENFKILWQMISNQSDGLYWNSTTEYGLYYKGTLFFAFLGLCYCIKDIITEIKAKTFSRKIFVMVPFLCSVLLGGLITVNVNRINCIHIWVITFISIGMLKVFDYFKKDFKYIKPVVIGLFIIGFLSFELFYFSTYKENIGAKFQSNLERSVEAAKELAGDEKTIYVCPEFSYAKILFYSKLPAPEYVETVKYNNYPAAFMSISSAGNYHFGIDEVDNNAVYIISTINEDDYMKCGFTVDNYGDISIAH